MDLNETSTTTQALTAFVSKFGTQSIEEAEQEAYIPMVRIVSDFVISKEDAIRKTLLKVCDERINQRKGFTEICGVIRASKGNHAYSMVQSGPFVESPIYLSVRLGYIDNVPEIAEVLNRSILDKNTFLAKVCFTYYEPDKHCALNKKFKAAHTLQLLDGVLTEIAIKSESKNGLVKYVLNVQFYLNTYIAAEQHKLLWSDQDKSQVQKQKQIDSNILTSHIEKLLSNEYGLDIAHMRIASNIKAVYADVFYENADVFYENADSLNKTPSLPLTAFLASLDNKPLSICTGVTLPEHVEHLVRNKVPVRFTESDNTRLNKLFESVDLEFSIKKYEHEFIVFVDVTKSQMLGESNTEHTKLNQLIRQTTASLGPANLLSIRDKWRSDTISLIIDWFGRNKSVIINGFYEFTRKRSTAINQNKPHALYKDRFADVDVPMSYSVNYDSYFPKGAGHVSFYDIRFDSNTMAKLNSIIGVTGFLFKYKFYSGTLSSIIVYPPADLLITYLK